MTEKGKEKFCELIKSCIGDRTLDQVSADTEAAINEMRENGTLDGKLSKINKISRNMLSRLKNGEFSRLPSTEYFNVLTHEKARPQNGITVKDLEDAFNDFNSEQPIENNIIKTEKTNLNADRYNKYIMMGIIMNWIIEQNQEAKIEKNIMVSSSATDHSINSFADICTEIGGVRYIFNIRMLYDNTESGAYAKADYIFSWFATYKIINSTDTLVIVTNSKKLFEEIQTFSLPNIKTKAQAWLIDLEKGNISKNIDLN